jgi:thiol-disulfide isomerase/thioredoxin
MIDLRGGTWLGMVPLVDRPSLGAGAQDLSDAAFSQVLSAPKAIVDFWSPGCPHCMQFKPIFEAVASQYPDILFAAVNVDNYQQNAAIYQISGLPTVVFYQNGKEVDRMVGGAGSAAEFQAEIAKAFSGGGSSPQGLTPAGVSIPASSAPSTLSTVVGATALVGVLGAVSYFGYQLLKK